MTGEAAPSFDTAPPGPGRSSGRFVSAGAFALLAVLLRLPRIGAPPRPDEAGYLLVARAASAGGPYLYGRLFVDRPPLLVLVFRLGDALGGVPALRVLGLLAVAASAAAATDAGVTIGGRRGGWTAGALTAALTAAPLLSAPEVDGELLALPLLLVGIAVGLRAVAPGHPPDAVRLSVAGLIAGSALLVKQNLADGVVLLAVLLLARLLSGELSRRRCAQLLGALLAGAALPLFALLGWAETWGAGADHLWRDLVAFRSSSLAVLAASPSHAAHARAAQLVLALVLSGVAPLVLLFGLAAGRRASVLRGPATAAVLVVAVEGGASIALGGSWWTHYLLELVPACALAAALLTTARGRWPRASTTLAAVALLSTVLTTARALPADLAGGCAPVGGGAQQTGRWLRAHAQPGDTAVVLYGGAEVLLASGLPTPYAYLWSLPVRTLDPRLTRLKAVVSGPDRVDWVVVGLPVDSWSLDADGSLQTLLTEGYTSVAEVCQHRTVLHRTA